jgi:AcrR family transcriptional regulator
MSDLSYRDGMKSVRSDARASRDALLEAARQMVAEGGIEALTVVGVAHRAGLNRSTAYQHFRTRDDLVRAVSEQFAAEVSRILSEPRSIGEQIDFFVHYFRDHPHIARIWMFRLLSGTSGGMAEGWEEYVGGLERLAKSGRGQAGIDAEMLGVIGMTSAMVWSLMASERNPTEEAAQAETLRFARELKRLFLFGALRPEGWPELVAELQPDRAAEG